MPFGLCNAPSTFMTLMNTVFREELDQFVIIYIDDILIYSKSWEEHLEHIRVVMEKLRVNKLYANAGREDCLGPESKCGLGRVKEILASEPVLKLPEFDKPFEVHTDASDFAIGGVLVQESRSVAYESRKLSDRESVGLRMIRSCMWLCVALRSGNIIWACTRPRCIHITSP
ncbi:hypothetical protein R1sor_000861 [Riccia sorocarpa]|uniref:Reverse transcriptase domain-containing protein n=1 Tax=Riccia sorocarpa TaxID=122646 RepID=A0ABD3GYB9_9MARC